MLEKNSGYACGQSRRPMLTTSFAILLRTNGGTWEWLTWSNWRMVERIWSLSSARTPIHCWFTTFCSTVKAFLFTSLPVYIYKQIKRRNRYNLNLEIKHTNRPGPCILSQRLTRKQNMRTSRTLRTTVENRSHIPRERWDRTWERARRASCWWSIDNASTPGIAD